MRTFLVILSVFCLAETVTLVTALTNREFVELIEPYATEVDDEGSSDDDNDVIDLPGSLDDDLDIEYLLSRLSEDEVVTSSDGSTEIDVALPARLQGFHCSCRRRSCSCCLSHTFKVWRKKFRLHACLAMRYLHRNYGFELTFTVNGRRVYHREISLKHPPGICYGITRFARVCLELYNINLQRRSLCARLTGRVNLIFKKFSVHLKLGCMRIPILEKDAFNMILNDPDFLTIQRLSEKDESRDSMNLYF